VQVFDFTKILRFIEIKYNRMQEGIMAVEVMIRRATQPGNSAKILLPYIIELRAHAVKQPGYISGETLFNIDRAEECVVISRWTKLAHWQDWLGNPIRMGLNEEVERLLASNAEYNIYRVSLW
jgi:heme-degrading monooxygenase HmoA